MFSKFMSVFSKKSALISTVLISLCLASSAAISAPGASAPSKQKNEGEGPYSRLILRAVNIVNGEGAPARGPVDIVIEKNRITNIVDVGHPGVPIKSNRRPTLRNGDKEMVLPGYYVMPGFIDMHGHIGGSADNIPAEYVFKLWLGHGITTVREPGSFNGLEWVLDHVERSKENTIVAPRIIPYLGFGMGSEKPIYTAKQARGWIKKPLSKVPKA
jgi:adenine deaminase